MTERQNGFDEVKYKALLEGLEITEIYYQNLLNHTVSLRIDSEYFKKEYLAGDRLLKHKTCEKLVDLTRRIDVGFVGSMTSYYRETGITLLQTKNINSFFISDSDTIKITEEFHKGLPKSQINFKDILIARSGSFGKASIYLEKETINSSDIIIIEAKEKAINPFYLTAFLNSRSGVDQMIRFASGGLQGHVNLTIIEELQVPVLSNWFQQKIEDILWKSYVIKKESQNKYQQAETLVLETLGLSNFEPSQEPVNVKGFKESFLTTGRLDAEYYQKKYEEIEQQLRKNGVMQLKDVFKLLSYPSPSNYLETGTKVIKTKNIRIPSVEIENITDHTNEDCLLVEKNDLLFASMGVGSLGRVSYIEGDIENCTIDGTIKIFRCRNEYQNRNLEVPTLLFLTSSFGQELIYKHVIGSTGIISISKENIENLIIPIFDKSTAETLTSMVLESQNLKKQSEQLLETAKRAVEIAIEQDEATALRYVEKAQLALM